MNSCYCDLRVQSGVWVGLLDGAWFCMFKLGGSLAVDECKVSGGW